MSNTPTQVSAQFQFQPVNLVLFADGSVPLTGNLNASGHTITNISNPIASGQAANKAYVDSVVGSGTFVGAIAGGDLRGTYPNPIVSGIQGIPIVNQPSSTSDILIYSAASGNYQWGSISISNNATVISAAGTYTVLPADNYIYSNANTGVQTINLPVATGSGRLLSIKKIDNSSHATIVQANGSNTIDGANTQILTSQWVSILIQDSQSNNWFIN